MDRTHALTAIAARLAGLAGQPVAVTERAHVEFATIDTVRNFARGSADDNPL